MEVKHNHSCNLCNEQSTCFLFKEFSMLFSVCRRCYDQLVLNYPAYDVKEDRCSFCEKERDIKIIEGFPESLFFTEVKICSDCFNTIQKNIESEKKSENKDTK